MRERLELWGRALGQSLRQALQFDPDFFSSLSSISGGSRSSVAKRPRLRPAARRNGIPNWDAFWIGGISDLLEVMVRPF